MLGEGAVGGWVLAEVVQGHAEAQRPHPRPHPPTPTPAELGRYDHHRMLSGHWPCSVSLQLHSPPSPALSEH